jgi:hypothetical protein
MNGNDINPNLGDLETIWNSSASHLSHEQAAQVRALLFSADNYIDSDFSPPECGEFLKGWNKEWGSLGIPSFHARIGQLFDRDYVWVVTQTMVSFEKLTLWAVHNVLTYKVYPGFWGRILGLLHELIF